MLIHIFEDCESVSKAIDNCNELFDDITVHNVLLNNQLQLLNDKINMLDRQLFYLKSGATDERLVSVRFHLQEKAEKKKSSPKEQKDIIKDLAYLLYKAKDLYDEHMILLSVEKEFYDSCLQDLNRNLSHQLDQLQQQITFYKSAIQNVDKKINHKMSYTDLFKEMQKQSDASADKILDDELYKLREKVKKKLQKTAIGSQTELENRNKLIHVLHKQQLKLEKRINVYKEQANDLEKRYQIKLNKLQDFIKSYHQRIKTSKKRRVWDSEGFLNDVKMLYEELLHIQRKVKDPAINKQILPEITNISLTLNSIKEKIIDVYHL